MNKRRILTGVVAIPLLLGIIWWLPPQVFGGAVALAAMAGVFEFFRMRGNRGGTVLLLATMIFAGLLVAGFGYAVPKGKDLIPLLSSRGYIFAITVMLISLVCARLFSRRPVEGALEDIAAALLAMLYTGVLFSFQLMIRTGLREGAAWLTLLYVIIWSSDTAAYYLGSAYGRRKLYEKISPKKSIEGLAAGLLAAAGASLACSFWLPLNLGWIEAVVAGIVLAAFGVIGDLAESLFKRSAGVKDSGALLPGHGGILDRFDSVLFAAPLLYYYAIVKELSQGLLIP